MPSAAESAHFTWDDFVALGDDDLRELIDGELVEVEVPTADHEDIVGWLCFYLRAWTEAGPSSHPTPSAKSSHPGKSNQHPG